MTIKIGIHMNAETKTALKTYRAKLNKGKAHKISMSFIVEEAIKEYLKKNR